MGFDPYHNRVRISKYTDHIAAVMCKYPMMMYPYRSNIFPSYSPLDASDDDEKIYTELSDESGRIPAWFDYEHVDENTELHFGPFLMMMHAQRFAYILERHYDRCRIEPVDTYQDGDMQCPITIYFVVGKLSTYRIEGSTIRVELPAWIKWYHQLDNWYPFYDELPQKSYYQRYPLLLDAKFHTDGRVSLYITDCESRFLTDQLLHAYCYTHLLEQLRVHDPSRLSYFTSDVYSLSVEKRFPPVIFHSVLKNNNEYLKTSLHYTRRELQKMFGRKFSCVIQDVAVTIDERVQEEMYRKMHKCHMCGEQVSEVNLVELSKSVIWKICGDCYEKNDSYNKAVTSHVLQAKSARTFGFELEMVSRHYNDPEFIALTFKLLRLGYLRTHDSTVTVEMKSPIFHGRIIPHWHLKLLREAVEYVKDEEAGTHIHVGLTEGQRRILYPEHTSRRMSILIAAVGTHMLCHLRETIAIWGRGFNQYCQIGIDYDSHYNWLSRSSHYNTIEFRLPKLYSVQQFNKLPKICQDLTDAWIDIVQKQELSNEQMCRSAVEVYNNMCMPHITDTTIHVDDISDVLREFHKINLDRLKYLASGVMWEVYDAFTQ